VVAGRWLTVIAALLLAALWFLERRCVRAARPAVQKRRFIMRSMSVDVKLLNKEAAELTDRALEELIPSVETVPASIHGAMRHSTFAGGKRLRPVLAYAGRVTIAGNIARGH
jgi:hypothetical protein